MGNKPLSWQQALSVVIVMVTLITVSCMLSPDFRPQWEAAPWATIATAVVLVIVLLFSHYLRANQPDIYPDILRSLRSEREIFQLGHSHVSASAIAMDDRLRVVLLIQSAFDSPANADVDIKTHRNGHVINAPIPRLSVELPPATVILSHIDLPLLNLDQPTPVSLLLYGSCCRTGGRRIRFARYSIIRKPVSPLRQLALLPFGLLIQGGGLVFGTTLFPVHPQVSPTAPEWQFTILWTPDQQLPTNEIGALIEDVMDNTLLS